jgi:cell division protein FtsL
MKKLFTGLTVIIVVLSFLCGFLFLQRSDLQNQNAVLEDQISEQQNQMEQLENQTSELSNQIDERENQISELEDQIEELEKQLEEPTYEQKLSDAKQVKITQCWTEYDVTMSSGGGNHDVFYIQIQNFAPRSVEKLRLFVRQRHVYSFFNFDGENEFTETIYIGTIEAGSTKTLDIVTKEAASKDMIYFQNEIDDIILLWCDLMIDGRHFYS